MEHNLKGMALRTEDDAYVITVQWGGQPFLVTVSNDGGVAVGQVGDDGVEDPLKGKQVWVDPYKMNNAKYYDDQGEGGGQPLLVHAYTTESDEPATLMVGASAIELSNNAQNTLTVAPDVYLKPTP